MALEDAGDVVDTPPRAEIGEGVSAGIMSALVMGAILMTVSAMNGLGFFTPLQLIGATFFGVDWVNVPVWSSILGLFLHLGTGGALGALFAAMVRDVDGLASRLASGVAFGAAVFLVMTFLVLPWANPVMYYAVDKGVFFLAHLAFGLTLPLAQTRQYPIVHRFDDLGHARRA